MRPAKNELSKADRKAWTKELRDHMPAPDPGPMTGAKFWPIIPRPAPRQSQRDKIEPSLMVIRYRAFCTEIRLKRVWLPTPGDLVVFLVPMPKSWPKYKKAELDGMPKETVPDADNYLKAWLDAAYVDDAHIWTIVPAKVWSSTPGIYIERREPEIRIPFKLAVVGID